MGENIKGFIGVKDKTDYLNSLKKLVEESEIEMTLIEKDNINLDGQEFATLEILTVIEDIEVRQAYSIAIVNRVAISIVVTYFDDTTEIEVKELLSNYRKID